MKNNPSGAALQVARGALAGAAENPKKALALAVATQAAARAAALQSLVAKSVHTC